MFEAAFHTADRRGSGTSLTHNLRVSLGLVQESGYFEPLAHGLDFTWGGYVFEESADALRVIQFCERKAKVIT